MTKFKILLLFSAAISLEASGVQEKGCEAGTTIIAFRSEKKSENDYQARLCDGLWHVNNQAGEDIFIGDDNTPCVKNTSNKEVLCGAQITSGTKVDTNAKQDGTKESKYMYDKEKKTLYLYPLDLNGVRSRDKPFFKISGSSEKKSSEIKDVDKSATLTIEQEKPDAPTSDQKYGSLTLEHKIGGGKGQCDDNKSEDKITCRLEDFSTHGYSLTDSDGPRGAFTDNGTPLGGAPARSPAGATN